MAKVTISSVIDAPVEKVWARIRDFNGLPGWHPRMVESHIEDGKDAGTLGCGHVGDHDLQWQFGVEHQAWHSTQKWSDAADQRPNRGGRKSSLYSG